MFRSKGIIVIEWVFCWGFLWACLVSTLQIYCAKILGDYLILWIPRMINWFINLAIVRRQEKVTCNLSLVVLTWPFPKFFSQTVAYNIFKNNWHVFLGYDHIANGEKSITLHITSNNLVSNCKTFHTTVMTLHLIVIILQVTVMFLHTNVITLHVTVISLEITVITCM